MQQIAQTVIVVTQDIQKKTVLVIAGQPIELIGINRN